MNELRGLQLVAERIARAADLDALLSNTLTALDESLGFAHSMVLIHDECSARLETVARSWRERPNAAVMG